MPGFNVNSLNQMISNLGQTCVWEQASRCPCRSTRTGGASVACPVCNGAGFVWTSPTTCIIGVEGFRVDKQYAMWSEVEKGDQIATIPSDSAAYSAGEYDSFTMLDAEIRIDQILTKGSADRLKYRTVLSLDGAWGIVAGARVDLVQGLDFTLNGNLITWTSSAIPVGAQYSITYVARPEFYVYRTLVSDRPHGHVPLPRKVHLKGTDCLNKALVNA